MCPLNGFLKLSHFETNESTVTNNNVRSTKQSQDPYWKTESPETENVNFLLDFINVHHEKDKKIPHLGALRKCHVFRQ